LLYFFLSFFFFVLFCPQPAVKKLGSPNCCC
jgi:hypothetical protein